MTNDEIKNKISSIFTNLRMSNRQLSERLCLCERSVQRWKNGRLKKCDIYALNDIASRLGYVMVIEFYERH